MARRPKVCGPFHRLQGSPADLQAAMKGTFTLQSTSINCLKLPEKEDDERPFQVLLAGIFVSPPQDRKRKPHIYLFDSSSEGPKNVQARSFLGRLFLEEEFVGLAVVLTIQMHW